MADLLALKELRDKVAAGTATKRDFILSDLVPHDRSGFRAFDGSLDASKALHEALLPGYDWIIGRTNDGLTVHANVGSEAEAFDDCPARAWLLAILTALIAQNASNDQRAPE